jgi:hypothetical protein
MKNAFGVSQGQELSYQVTLVTQDNNKLNVLWKLLNLMRQYGPIGYADQ